MMLHGEPLKGLSYGLSVFQPDFTQKDNSQDFNSNRAVRVAANFAEIGKIDNTVLHFGAGKTTGSDKVAHTSSSGGGTSTTAAVLNLAAENRGTKSVYRVRLDGPALTTGGYSAPAQTFTNIEKSLQGLELAVARGPFKFQMETFDTDLTASNAVGDAAVLGYKADYVELMYNITGESWSKAYKGGAFSGISPDSVFMKDYGGVVGKGIGAWQVGFRQSTYKVAETLTGVTSTGSKGGKTDTFALNWILNNNARAMLNYSETKFDTSFTPIDTSGNKIDKERTISLRTQVNF
jgi:phosphate-selective porin